MRIPFRIPTAAAVAVAALAASFAQEAKLPTPDAILAAYIQATGGKAVIEKATSRQAKGSFEMTAMGLKGGFEMFAKAPDKFLMKMDVPGFGPVQEGFDGTVAWSQNPAQGLREKSGVELAFTKRSSQFYRDLRLKELYPKMEVKGVEKVGEKDVYHVEAIPAEGGPEQWYFDKASGLMIRFIVDMEGPQGKVTITTDVEDYKGLETGGKIPMLLRQKIGSMEMHLRIEDVKVNVAIDEAIFRKPAA